MLAREAIERFERSDDLNARGLAWLTLAEVHQIAGRREQGASATQTAVRYYEQKGNVSAASRVWTRDMA